VHPKLILQNGSAPKSECTLESDRYNDGMDDRFQFGELQ